jgi:hypothetical protein
MSPHNIMILYRLDYSFQVMVTGRPNVGSAPIGGQGKLINSCKTLVHLKRNTTQSLCPISGPAAKDEITSGNPVFF